MKDNNVFVQNGFPIEGEFFDARDRRASVSPHKNFYGLYGKRIFDIALALALLPLLLPLISVVWLLTRRDGGPGFFGQTRIGMSGQSFRCWKLRTMTVNAEAVLKKLFEENPEMAEEWRLTQKLKNDPRITKIGRFLRKTSLDELPQVWNVLKGEMSFVGPRPVLRDALERYGRNRRAYLSVRPGITGLWQVSGRNDVSYEQRIKLDVDYRSDMSLLTDIKLIAKTIGVVFKPTGY